jgi:hypothetical protein
LITPEKKPNESGYFGEIGMPLDETPLSCQSNVAGCQDNVRERDYFPQYICSSSRSGGVVRCRMKIIQKAKYIKSGETVLDRGSRFIIKEVRVSTVDGGVVFIDMEGVGHGAYHPDEYLGVGEALAHKYAATYGRQIPEETCQLNHMPSQMVH